MLWWLFMIVFFSVLIFVNHSQIGPRIEKIRWALRLRREITWTTFYFTSKRLNHIHLVPLDGKAHITDEDGDCMCHTQKEQYNAKTVVYRHQQLGLKVSH